MLARSDRRRESAVGPGSIAAVPGRGLPAVDAAHGRDVEWHGQPGQPAGEACSARRASPSRRGIDGVEQDTRLPRVDRSSGREVIVGRAATDWSILVVMMLFLVVIGLVTRAEWSGAPGHRSRDQPG